MSNCERIRILLALRPEDRSESERDLVAAHLETCADCAELAGAYAEQDRLLRRVAQGDSAGPEWGALLARIDQERRGWVVWTRAGTILRSAIAIAALLALVLGLNALFQQIGGFQPVQPAASIPTKTSTLSPAPTATHTPSASPTTASTTQGMSSLPDLGRLAYIYGGDIWAMELPNGQPQRLTTDGGYREPRWSASGEWLAFRQGDRLWLARADGSEARTLNEELAISAFAWSPVDDQLAYVAGGQLYTSDVERSTSTVSAPSAGDESVGRIAWSPDGAWIGYEWQSQQPGQPPAYQGLWKVSADGGEPVEIYDSGVPERGDALLAGWTADGRYLLFWQGDLPSASLLADGVPLYALPAAGRTPVQLATPVLVHADSIAPDPFKATLVALVQGGGRATWTGKELYVVSIEGMGYSMASPPGLTVSSPAWSPDGSRIAYVAMPDQGDVAGGEPARQGLMGRRIWVAEMGAELQQQQRTDDLAYRDEYPLWSRDGDYIVFARIDKEGRASLWTMPAEEGDPIRMVDELDLPSRPGAGAFGSYGHLDWAQAFDWWRGLPSATPAKPSPTAQVSMPTRTPVPATRPTDPQPAPLAVTFGYGIEAQAFADPQGVTEAVQDLGHGWLKQEVRWAQIEPAKGTYDWEGLDAIVASCSEAGIHVLLSVTEAPD